MQRRMNCHGIAKTIDIFIEISLVKKTVSKARNKKNIKFHLNLVNEMREMGSVRDYVLQIYHGAAQKAIAVNSIHG